MDEVVKAYVGAVNKASLAANAFFLDLLLIKLKESKIEASPWNNKKLDSLKKLVARASAAKVKSAMEVLIYMDYKVG